VILALAAHAACTRTNPAYRSWTVSGDADDGVPVDLAAPVPDAATLPPDAAALAPDASSPDLPAPTDVALAPPDLPAVSPGGLLARWRLDESTGPAALDDTGANPGVLHNGVARVTETFPGARFPNPRAASFDGDDDYIDLGVATLPPMQAAKSISLWCSPSEVVTSGRRNLIVFNNRNARESLQLGLENGYLAVWGWGSAPSRLISSARLETRWYHVVYAYDGAVQRLYVDGQWIVDLAAAPPTAPVADAHLGTYDPAQDRTELWNGFIDDVRIYDHGLTASEIAWLAAGGD
jgi:hypothetical protein